MFHKDSIYGVSYDSLNGKRDNKRMLVDSALKSIKGTNNYENFLSMKPDSIIWNERKTVLKEVFFGKDSVNCPKSRFVLHYSIEMNNVKASINSKMDSAKKIKLYKTEIFLSEYYSEREKTNWPAMHFSTEIREFVVKDSKEVMGYIHRYQKNM